jgi:MFS family permease
LAGFGLGLRWIGVEPWLYRIAPSHARGRLVGFHESLIALAPVVGPLVTGQFALKGSAVFWIGSAFTALALLPLALARSPSRAETQPPAEARGMNLRAPLRERVFRVGIAVALVGGAIDAAVTGLFALFAQDRGLVVDQVANLLAIYGVGGLLIQYPVGSLCDHRGVGPSALWCAIGTLITALVLSVPLPYALFVGAMFLMGGFINAFLTLALIASAMTRGGNMETNVSLISMLFTGAAALGPLTAGAVMKSTQPASLMWFAATAALIMVAALIAIVVPRSSAGVSEAAAGLGERT